MYDPLLDKVALFEGSWVIDESPALQDCQGGRSEDIYPQTLVAAPADPEAQGSCPAPSAFYTIATGTVKDCAFLVDCPSTHSSLAVSARSRKPSVRRSSWRCFGVSCAERTVKLRVGRG